MTRRNTHIETVELRTDGSMLHPFSYSTAYKTVSNTVWKDRLEYIGMIRGRSALQFEWRSLNSGRLYYMLSSTFNELMKQETGVPAFTTHTHVDKERAFSKSILTGNFTFEKKGSVYGIKLVERD